LGVGPLEAALDDAAMVTACGKLAAGLPCGATYPDLIDGDQTNAPNSCDETKNEITQMRMVAAVG
jgi:hypothetical protein